MASERERKYGMEPGDIEWLDHGKCWICREPEMVEGRNLAVDHDHTTGAVRGFLCYRCNTILGRASDNPDLLRRAADYLDRAALDFADLCTVCAADDTRKANDVIVAPTGVLERDGDWTVFGYQCPQGHRWSSGRKTRGTPFSWRI